MGSEAEQELDDRWWFGLRGRTVESVEVYEFTVTLHFGEGSALTVESGASLRRSSEEPETPGVVHHEDGSLSATDAIFALSGQRVVSGVGFKSGALRLVFESGVTLTVPPGDRYESWQLTGPSGRMWVSVPGGGLTTFPAASA